MKINFDLYQKVWFMLNNKPKEGSVHSITINKNSSQNGDPHVILQLKINTSLHKLNSNEVFISKDALCESLFGDILV